MIAFLKGNIEYITKDFIELNVNNIGYEINIAKTHELKKNTEIYIYIYQHIREDINILFGFTTRENKNMFMQLINVKGIGPKTALGFFQNADALEITNAIVREDITFLKNIPGIGQKAASQLILDLRGKVIKEEVTIQSNSELQEALQSLGYKKNEILKIEKHLKADNLNGQIKEALGLLAK